MEKHGPPCPPPETWNGLTEHLIQPCPRRSEGNTDLRADDQRLLLDQTRLFVDGSDAHSVRIVVEAAGRRRYDTERSEATRVGDDGHVGAVTERLLLAAAHAPRTVLAHAPRVGCTKSPLSIVFSSRCLGVELESFSAN